MPQSLARPARVALFAIASAAPWAGAAGQSIAINLGSSTQVAAAPGTKLTVPIVFDLSASGGAANIASLQAGLTWNATRLTFDSLRRQSTTAGWSLTSNTANAASGSITFSVTRATNLSATATVLNAFFSVTGASGGGTHLVLAPTGAANAAAQSMLAAIRPRALDVCLVISGRWGDVTNDGMVDIADAQQIARFSAGLSVVDPIALAQRGDVNADGVVDVVDAQDIAEFTVGLPSAPRINTDIAAIPAATAMTLAPAGPLSLTLGESRQLVSASSAGATDLTGCAPTAWISTNPGVAVVNQGGFVTTVGAGAANIIADIGGGISSSVALDVKVLIVASRLGVSVQPSSSAGSGVVFARQPAVQLLTSTGQPAPLPGVVVTAAIASGGGTLGGSPTAITDVNGVAVFSGLSITGLTGVRTLSFSSLGLVSVTSALVSISAGAATQLQITTQPSATAANGVAFSQQPAIQLRDAAGNAVAQPGVVVSAVVASGNGTLGGSVTSNTNSGGLAAFTDLAINGSGNHTVRFASTNLTPATSGTITVNAPATQLTITTQPSATALGGVPLVQQPVIQLRNASGVAVGQAGVVVTAAIASGPGTLGGVLTATTNSSGVATFAALFIYGTGGSNTLRFTAPSLTGVVSSAIAATTGNPPLDAEPVQGPADIVVYQDNMDRYVSPTQMWSDYNNSPNTPQVTTQEQPTHPGWQIIAPGRGGAGKALRVNYLGQEQTGAAWLTVGMPNSPALATHYITYYAKITFSTPLLGTLGVKWFEGVHPVNNRVQWHMHWLNGTCSPVPVGTHNTFWQVMDQSRSTACQGAQPLGPYIENVTDGQWRRFTYEYRPNSKAGARDGVARMWVNGVKITDVSLAAVGVTPPGGNKTWCTLEDLDKLATNEGVSALKWGDIQTTRTPPWTLEVDDVVWWRR